MRRVLVRRPGSYDKLEFVEETDPTAGPGETAIDVRAIGVNYADCVIRMGLYASAMHYVDGPITPGFDIAGETSDGRRVVAVTRFGGYATRVVVPSHQVFEMPDGMSFEEAAAFPTIFLTAWYALFELGRPRPGKRALVHSAAGGVGSALLQLLQIADCRAAGVVGREEKVEAARALGADPVTVGDFAGDYDLVFDANGYKTLRRSYEALRPTGRLVVYGFHSMLPRKGGKASALRLLWGWLQTPRFSPLKMTGENRSVLGFNLSYLFEERHILEEGMTMLLDWYRQGRIRLPAIQTYPFADVADAHKALESGTTVGKLVLLP
ncbi:MAG: medium chain dehydrogenase/reductase family protein [Planctomycetota bacterium]